MSSLEIETPQLIATTGKKTSKEESNAESVIDRIVVE